MSGLNGVDRTLRAGIDSRTVGRTAEKPVMARSVMDKTIKDGFKGAEISEPCRTDRVMWSGSRSADELGVSVQDFFVSMKQYYPDIQFHMPGRESTGDFAWTAAGFGKGMHIAISSEFLERMGSSREEFVKCSKVLLNEAAKLLKGAGTSAGCGVFLEKDRAVAWSASPNKREQYLPVAGGSQDKRSAGANDIRYSYHPAIHVSGHFSQMASARTTGQVQRVMGDIQYSMMSLKITAVYGDDEQRVKASRAVRSLQKLLSRGSRKIRRLNRERLKQCARKKAQRQKEEQKSRRLELELKKMRSARAGADCSLVKEGMADEAYIRSYRRYKGLQEPYAGTALAPGDMVMLQSLPGMDMGTAGGGFSAGDVTFSGEYSF